MNEKSTPQRASHDSGIPDNLKTFLLQGWRPDAPPAAAPVVWQATYQARRKALSAMFPNETLIIPTGVEKVRANDTHYRFRPGTDFYYLTGAHEPDCVLVLEPLAEGGHRDVLYVEPNTRDDITFFSDRQKGELWTGRRLGLDGSRQHFGVAAAASLRDLKDYLGKLGGTPHRVLRGLDPAVDGAVATTEGDTKLAEALSELRLLKDDAELDALTEVIAATARGFEDVIRKLPTMQSEREVEATFYYRARTEGNDVGYGTIAACGANACILHWTRNNATLKPGELLLLDAGVEGNSLYTADITRTLPISGRFSPAQRAIYTLVYKAQRAAMDAVKPGVDFMAPNKIAMEVLARGLEELGILPMSAEEALKQENQFYRRYSLHNISHMLGLDVHDCAKARTEVYRFGQLKVGMVFTVEPGLYFQPDDETVPEAYRGIGVRIEDDIVVTEDGYRNLSDFIPADPDGVEAWMAQVWAASRA